MDVVGEPGRVGEAQPGGVDPLRADEAGGDGGVELLVAERLDVLLRGGGEPLEVFADGLLERSVLVRNCASWPRLDGCLRVTIGTPAEDDAFLSALKEILG